MFDVGRPGPRCAPLGGARVWCECWRSSPSGRVVEGLKWRGSLGEGGEAPSLGMVSLRCSWGDVQEALHWTHDSEDQGERSASGTFWNSPACVVTATDVLIG